MLIHIITNQLQVIYIYHFSKKFFALLILSK